MKLRLSGGDLKAVQGDGGWNTPDMVTKRYAHILDEDRRKLATNMEVSFYQGNAEPAKAAGNETPLDLNALTIALKESPELLIKIVESIQLANTK